MYKHEQKYCPECHSSFECKVGSILQCQCAGITLSEEEQGYLKNKYADCLCRNCLKTIKATLQQEKMQQNLSKISTLFNTNKKKE